MIVLAIDPGKTCGWSIGRGQCHIESGQHEAAAMLSRIDGMMTSPTPIDRMVVERFNPRRWDQDSVATVEVIGAIRWLAWKGGVGIAEVGAADRRRVLGEVEHIEGRHARDAEACRLWDLRYGRWE